MPLYNFVCTNTHACGEPFPTAVYMNLYRFEEEKRTGFHGVECPQCGSTQPRHSFSRELAARDITPRGTFGRAASPALKGQSFYGKSERDRLLASVGSAPACDDDSGDVARPSTTKVYRVINGTTRQIAGPADLPSDDGTRAMPTSEVEHLVVKELLRAGRPLGASDVLARVKMHQTVSIANVRKVLSNMAKERDDSLVPVLHRPARGKYAPNPAWLD